MIDISHTMKMHPVVVTKNAANIDGAWFALIGDEKWSS